MLEGLGTVILMPSLERGVGQTSSFRGSISTTETRFGYGRRSHGPGIRDAVSHSKKRRRSKSHTRTRVVFVALVVVALAGGFAYATGILSISASHLSSGLSSLTGSNAAALQKYPYWPQDSISILNGLCSNGTSQFWVQQKNFSGTLSVIDQDMLTSCNVGKTSGGIVMSQQGLYLYEVKVQENATAVSTQTPYKHH